MLKTAMRRLSMRLEAISHLINSVVILRGAKNLASNPARTSVVISVQVVFVWVLARGGNQQHKTTHDHRYFA